MAEVTLTLNESEVRDVVDCIQTVRGVVYGDEGMRIAGEQRPRLDALLALAGKIVTQLHNQLIY